jgi:hypothetical protein
MELNGLKEINGPLVNGSCSGDNHFRIGHDLINDSILSIDCVGYGRFAYE